MSREKIHDLLNIEDILVRFKEFMGFESDGEVAKLFEITVQNLCNMKKTDGLIPYFIKHGLHSNMNLHWVLTGKGPRSIAGGMSKSDEQSELEAMAIRVLQSNTHYARSLSSNIISFEKGLKSEQDHEQRIARLERKDESIRANDPVEKKDELLKLRIV